MAKSKIASASTGMKNERHEEIASALSAQLDALPRLRGFRLRGMQMTRLETFIDAAFAFAISMLVIAAQQIPDDIASLLAAFKNVPTFVCSIAVLGIFWWGHWLWRRYGLDPVNDDSRRAFEVSADLANKRPRRASCFSCPAFSSRAY